MTKKDHHEKPLEKSDQHSHEKKPSQHVTQHHHTTEHKEKHLKKSDHHYHEKRQPQFTTIVNEKKWHTFARGEMVDYKVRWRGADAIESWISRDFIINQVKEKLFPKHCLDIVHNYEKKGKNLSEGASIANGAL